MSKTASPAKAGVKVNAAEELKLQARLNRPLSLATIFNTMRILKKVNPGDAYLENYVGMLERYGEAFFDTYQLLWAIAIYRMPKRILEIGTRTGISMCQLLSAHPEREWIETVVCVDPFDQWTSPNLVRSNLKYLNLPADPDRIKVLAMTSNAYFNSGSTGKFDYILVDGDHAKEAAHQDLDAAHHLLERGGVIVFDDISTAPGECALIDVWEAWKAEHLTEYDFCEIMDGKGVAFAIKK